MFGDGGTFGVEVGIKPEGDEVEMKVRVDLEAAFHRVV